VVWLDLAALPDRCHDHQSLAVLGGIVGAIAGFVVGVVIHVAFWNDAGWADIIPFGLAVAGVLVGAAFGPRLADRSRRAS
jgi:hypothetical protein